MNKKINQYVPICFIAAFCITIALIIFFAKPAWQEYSEAVSSSKTTASELSSLSERMDKEKQRKAEEELNLKSIKQILESEDSTINNLAAFGSMFDDIIKEARVNNLLIRSIEYDTKPSGDVIYDNFGNQYNVCKLKFFFIGHYSELRNFLNSITKEYKYLISVSDIKVTAFEGNTDYILINLSTTLYSRKPVRDEE